MKRIEDVTFCVEDHGLFFHVAQCLAEQAKKVYYCGPPERVMRLLEDDSVGDGFENIERVESIWEVDEKCDAFVFPDIGFGWDQKKLIREGRPVWGHRGADVLEFNKGKFLKTLESLGMEVPPHKVVVGIDALVKHLWDEKDKWVKVSKWRGNWDTTHWRNRELDLLYVLGHPFNRSPLRNHIRFYVFDKIDTKIEDGIDTWRVNKQWPKTVFHAMEKKDKSLIGAMQSFSDIHEDVRMVNEVFGDALDQYGYCGAFSTEVRIADVPFFNDATCRFGSPPSQLQTLLITNLPDVIYRGANGECIEPEYSDPIGAQVLITTDREKDEWATLDFSEELKPHVKSAFACEADGVVRICPNPLENWAGWLVATGKDIFGVIDMLKDLKEMLPAGFDCDLTSLCDLLTELKDAEKHNIQIAEDIPTPSEVVEG